MRTRTYELRLNEVVNLDKLLTKFPNARLTFEGIEVEVDEPIPKKYLFFADYGTLTGVTSYLAAIVKQNKDWIDNKYGTPMDSAALRSIENLLKLPIFRAAIKECEEAQKVNTELTILENTRQETFEEIIQEVMETK